MRVHRGSEAVRTLIVIPIIHTEHDTGSLLEQVKHEYVTRFGEQKWGEHLHAIDQIWNTIYATVRALHLPYASVRIYQDGLPVCGKEVAIVREVAGTGSRNHQLVLELIEKGAQVMGTEDPNLLVQEYQLLRGSLADPNKSSVQQQHRDGQGRALLSARDRFIARRINDTLRVGETGLLFVGMAHRVEPLLAGDVSVRHLVASLKEMSAGLAP